MSNQTTAPPASASASAQLPPNYDVAKDDAGRLYHINHETKTTSWISPDGQGKPFTPGLPLPYERLHDAKGRAYYMNHETKTTSWLDPVKAQELLADGQSTDNLQVTMLTKEVSPREYLVDYGDGTVTGPWPLDSK